ncbi:MAG: threonylcarbamoyl-AMP synthase [Clostridiales bacterium]|nr:threonylcarbamoyl-AMP synthase [Clostridiales bacterium]
MNTLFVNGNDEENMKVAAAAVRDGEVVAFPTETVYGLGADALNKDAVKKIFEAKGRPGDNPLIVHIYDKSQIDDIASEITPLAQKLMDAFMPGPITVIVKKSSSIPDEVTAGLDTVGIRMPGSDTCRRFLSLCGCPVAAPSANLSGSPSPTSALHVLNDMDGRIFAIIDGGECEVGLESTVVDATGKEPVILIPGAVTKAMIDEATSSDIGSETLKEGQTPKAPGMKYRHYAPDAEVEIIFLPEDVGEDDILIPEAEGEDEKDPLKEMTDEQKKRLFNVASHYILR